MSGCLQKKKKKAWTDEGKGNKVFWLMLGILCNIAIGLSVWVSFVSKLQKLLNIWQYIL